MAAYIVANDGPVAGRKYDLGPRSVMGRHPDCEIVVDVGAVSRKHAQIIQVEDDFFLEDLKSRNGTFANEKMVEGRHHLLQDDQIRICDVTFSFHTDAPPPTIAEPESGSSTNLAASGGSGTIIVDDGDGPSSTVMKKLDVSSTRGRVHIASSPEAKLAALLDITQGLGKALALDEVLPKVLASLFKIFVQADRGFIVMKEDDKLIPMWAQFRREENNDTIRISRTIVSSVMDSQEAILSADAANDDRWELSQSIADFRIRSLMCAPLVNSEGVSIGALQIDTVDQRKRFQEEDLGVLASVASQAAISIDNARLYESALEQRELARDLEVAREVQKGFLPDAPPSNAGFSFYDYYSPTNQIGGDYYDYVELPDGRLAVIVADVVGHGVAAALLMAKLSAEARFSLAVHPDPGKAFNRLNNSLSRLPLDKFVTAVMVVINPATDDVTIVNAGHMAPLWRKADGSLSEPSEDEAGLPLGIVGGTEYQTCSIKINPGDSLTLFTDGVNEAMNARNEMFGIERLREFLTSVENPTTTIIGETILRDIKNFLGSVQPDDDVCLVVVGRDEAPSDTIAK